MANIMMNRIDFRLVHGQVAGTWIRNLGVTRIIILSDEVGSDPFMIDMYKLAAPAGCEINAYTVADGCKMYKDGDWGEDKTLVLFKYTREALAAWNNGFEFDALNVGQVPSGPGKRQITPAVSLDQAEMEELQQLSAKGVRVYFQAVPIEDALEFSDIK